MTYEKRDHPEASIHRDTEYVRKCKFLRTGDICCDCDGTGQDISEVVVNSGAPGIESLAS
jgi:hypothetical protein